MPKEHEKFIEMIFVSELPVTYSKVHTGEEGKDGEACHQRKPSLGLLSV